MTPKEQAQAAQLLTSWLLWYENNFGRSDLTHEGRSRPFLFHETEQFLNPAPKTKKNGDTNVER